MALPEIILRRTNITKQVQSTNPLFKKIDSERAGYWIEKGIITSNVVDFKSEKGTKVMPHPDKGFKLYQQIFQKVPVAKCSINSTVNFAIQSGYELEGSEEAVKKIEEWVDLVNFDLMMMDAMRQMQIYGNAWLEVSDIDSPKFLPVDQMYVVVHSGDENDGQIKGYKQIIKMGENEIPFDQEDMVHFKWNEESGLDGGFYGLSDLKAGATVLQRLLNFQEDIGEVIHNHAQPILHWLLGSEESPATQAQIDAFKTNLGDREVGGDLITSWGVEGKAVMSDLRMVQPDGMLKHLENQLICALGVPATFVRGGESSNKATAEVELQTFDRRVKSIRRVVSRYTEDYIFPLITGGEKVKILWNEPSFETEAKKAEMVKNLIAGNMPLVVALKIVGWNAFVNDLEEAGGEKEPMAPMGGPGGPPQEDDFDNQEDWLKALKEYDSLK